MDAPIARVGSACTSNGTRLAKTQETSVQKLAFFLGMDNGASDATGQAQNVKALFSSEIPDEDVVLVLPSLDMQVSENVTAATLPGVGETSSRNNGDNLNRPLDRPTMTASVLASATKDAAEAEQGVAQSLGKTTLWTKSTVAFAPAALKNNISSSFTRLVDSRMKAWTLLLLRHSLSTGDGSSRKRLLGILGTCLKVESATTKFRTLPLPDSAKGHQKEAEVILPLLFESHLNIKGKDGINELVTLRAPGTIAADFQTDSSSSAIKDVKIHLDCNSLLSSMVEQARMIVLKAVATSTKTQVPSTSTQSVQGQSQQPQDARKHESPALGPSTLLSTSKSLASFHNALNLSNNEKTAPRPSPGLKKAQKSALRLNSILQGNRDDGNSQDVSNLGMRKTRSVKWNTPGELPVLNNKDTSVPSPKKTRSTAACWTAAKLKSFKSFGRPHAGDFGSGPRNATFGEFGGRAGSWGKDGRMSAHPTPIQDTSVVDPISGEFQKADKNATFNLSTARPMSSALSNSMSGSRPSIHLSSGGKPLPRTATVLETLLRKSLK